MASAPALGAQSVSAGHEPLLRSIEDRILWLSTAVIDHANRVRPNPSGLKVDGHQASSASVVSIMTALWLEHLNAGDRVSVKPHASPVLHAINFLLGQLDESYLTRLREFGGLQAYPSRSKDPDAVDYSTGSVGIGATAPIWGALVRRYVRTHFGSGGAGRQYSLLGDAELDEGACWEAIIEPMIARWASSCGSSIWTGNPSTALRPASARHVCKAGSRQLAAGYHRQVRPNSGAPVHARRWGCAASARRRHDQPRIPASAAVQRT